MHPLCKRYGLNLNAFRSVKANTSQKLVKDFTSIGLKPEVKPLAFFQDDYGFEIGEGGELFSEGESTEGQSGEESGDGSE